VAGMEITSGAATGTRIVRQISGTSGGAGDYQVSISQTVASTAMNARFTTSKTEYVNSVILEPASMNISAAIGFDGGKIVKANTTGFNLLDGAAVTARNHGIEITGGGSIANSAYAFSSITSGTASLKYAGLWVDDARAEHSVKPLAYTGAGGTQTITVKSLEIRGQYKGLASKGDADVSLRVGRDRQTQRFSITLTADRTVTLETLDADDEDQFEILRPAGGAFNLLIKVGATTLATLAQNKSCRVKFDRDNNTWRVADIGNLV